MWSMPKNKPQNQQPTQQRNQNKICLFDISMQSATDSKRQEKKTYFKVVSIGVL